MVKTQDSAYRVSTRATSLVSQRSDINNLEHLKQCSYSKQDKNIISQTPEPVSKFCRFSKYFDFLQTPFSSLERSTLHKKEGDTVTNISKKSSSAVPSVSIKHQTDGRK